MCWLELQPALRNPEASPLLRTLALLLEKEERLEEELLLAIAAMLERVRKINRRVEGLSLGLAETAGELVVP